MSSPPRRVQESPPIIVCGTSPYIPKPKPSPVPSHRSSSSSTSDSPALAAAPFGPPGTHPSDPAAAEAEAIRLSLLCRASLNVLATYMPDFNPSRPYTTAEILALPLHVARAEDELLRLPRRKSKRMPLAAAVAALMFPGHGGSLSPLIRFDQDRVRLRGWVTVQAEYDYMVGTGKYCSGWTGRLGRNGGAAPCVEVPGWNSRILGQGAWDSDKLKISTTKGVPAGKIPVGSAKAEDMSALLRHLERGGTYKPIIGSEGQNLNDGDGEPAYGTRGFEFPRGIVFEDGRLDLYSQGVGEAHIEPLMRSLRFNGFVRHIQLGNNNIGLNGCRAIARYLGQVPDRVETWYLAGNGIDAAALCVLVDALVNSPAVTSVWLKRNALGQGSVGDIVRLLIKAENLRILDLDQTELGDTGVAALFDALAEFVEKRDEFLPLEVLYLNGLGVSTKACRAISRFLSAQARYPSRGRLHSISLSYNPLGTLGAQALAPGLRAATHLRRLTLQSTGLTTEGATALFDALRDHPNLRLLDLSQGYDTPLLGQAFNSIQDPALPSLCALVPSLTRLEYLSLGHSTFTPAALQSLSETVRRSTSLLSYWAASVHADTKCVKAFVPAQGGAHVEMATGAALTRELSEGERGVARRLEGNVRERFGTGCSYERFREEERRWVVVDRGVRRVDSVYKVRDVEGARRKVLAFIEEEKDDDDDEE